MSAPDERRVALVTGGGGGIGRAVAAALDADGYAVALLDRDRAAAEQAAAGLADAQVFEADVRERAAVDAAVAEVRDRYGRIDVLVHSAGILRTSRLLQLAEEEWDEVFDTNAKGRFLVSQAVAHVMIERGEGGVIVDVGSLSSERVPPGRLHYCVANGTVDALMRAMAVDLGRHGIRVLSIISGPVETPMIGGRADDPKRLDAFAQMIPLRRIAQPEDLARVVRFLAGDAARYMSGSLVHVDGGWTAG